MSFIYLIRHGQACASQEDYDQLSDLGKEQAQLLHHHLQNKKIDAVYVGPRKRHLQTYLEAQHDDWPMAIQANWLDEFPAFDLIDLCGTQIAQRAPELAIAIDEIQNQTGIVHPQTAKVLQKATQLWINGEIHSDELESFEAYEARLKIARGMLTQKREHSVLCFSSAGWIASFSGLLQLCDPAQSIRSAWALYNSSITTFKNDDNGPFLAAFNWIEHIPTHKRTFI
ncbi:MAG: hypothetical protein CMK59_02045 [Proteobacteria bacterium]|nr:hypothetical protein [Pseudomonadota bacterium]|tara:strand:+ start:70 stop:750 length:681 start_codon:yes stop_codon:yes gene_type:complete